MCILVILDCLDTAILTLETALDQANRLGYMDIPVVHPRQATDPDYQSVDEGMPTNSERVHFDREESSRAARLRQICEEWMKSIGGDKRVN